MLVDAPFRPSLLRVAPDFERLLRRKCEGIITDARAGRASSAAGEWLLENYSYLRTQVREVRESMPRGYYRRLPKTPDRDQPRIFTATERLILENFQDLADRMDAESLVAFFEDQQRETVLKLAELWAIRPMLKIALLQRLATGLTSGPLESAETESTVRTVISALRRLDDMMWPEFVEKLCVPDRILRDDPAGAYAGMDFDTRDRYRRAVEEIARQSTRSESDIAGLAVTHAQESNRHVGSYLIGAGLSQLRRSAQSRPTLSTFIRECVLKAPAFVYLGGSGLLTAVLLVAIERLAGPFPGWFLALLAIPASHSALAIANLLVSYFLSPRVQSRMDFRNGIPDKSRTAVVVPTLLLSKNGIQRLIENLEIYYLANRDRNLFFGLLTDLADADSETTRDDSLVEHAVAGIEELNRRYRDQGVAPFFLLHRNREWNACEQKWMGRERKRGKLDAFNQFLTGHENRFALTAGNLDQLTGTRYVITLDSDTQLPRDTAWKLVGTMAHPLNRPVFDERTGIVKSGYALMQPRIGISMESAGKSRFSAIYSGQTGFDPYTTAVSDTYQDLFGRATFTGKGIYDVAAFERATRGRFPDNTLLSHDLIEGEHVRAGLITDLEMIDDYPSRYQAFSKRKHRWVRGDWQIAMWLLPRVPDAQWEWKPNPLPVVSRWKILDNLRRSLVEIFYVLALFAGWLFLGSEAGNGTLAVVGLLFVSIYAEVAISIFRLPPLRFLRPWAWTRFSDFIRSHLEALLTLMFLPAQAALMIDAIARTIYRRFASRCNLLEWESMAQAEMAETKQVTLAGIVGPAALMRIVRSWNLPEQTLALGVLLALVGWTALLSMPESADPLAFTIVLAWMGAPGLIMWLNSADKAATASVAEKDFLRSVALSTWRYFQDHETAEGHWLVPDNIQEDPPAVAHRTSPTNLGLQLNALAAAHEFGYLTHPEFAARLERVSGTLDRLERDRGHFYNWYDTRTLAPLPPRFLSTVDSGNLAASLIVTRQACLALLDQPLIGRNTLDALRDHLVRLHETVPFAARTASIIRLFDILRRQLESEPDDLFFWEGVLTETAALVHTLQEHVEWAAARLEVRAPTQAAEIRHWMSALIDRIDSASRDLYEAAPWLGPLFETELRMALRNAQMTGLMQKLRAIPRLSDLAGLYDAVEVTIDELNAGDGRIHSSTLQVLNDLRASLPAARERRQHLETTLRAQAEFACELGRDMDFRFLFDERRKLFHIGWDVEAGALASSTYDLLASEARTGVFLAIARGDAPREAWFHLGRKLTYYRGHRTLISWSGTMFEYLMPALFMQTWADTLLGESLRSVVRIQQLYGRERRIPWGISESAHSGRDGALNYQYRAFGVPCCGLDRILPDDLVIAPYATVLSLMVEPRAAIENLRQMASRGWLAKYGFYEAIDFRRRARGQRKVEVIHAFMAHHQGMSFLSLANVLLGNPIQKLFHSDPSVLATELLLQERMPALAEAKAPEEPFIGLSSPKEGAAATTLEAEIAN